MGGKKKHQKKIEQDETQEKQAKQEQPEKHEKKEEESNSKFEVIAPKKVQYCPICTFPFELCKYGKSANQCILFLYKLAPTKVVKYHPTFKEQQIQELKKESKAQSADQQQDKQTTHPKQKVKSVKDKYIVIQVKNRSKKTWTTTVSGLHIFNIDAKEIAKKCSKKFAASCSAIELGTIQLQGDNFQNVKQFLIEECGAKKKYILSKEEFDEKYAQEVAKRKEEKKNQKNQIKEAKEEEEAEAPPAPVVKDKNQIRQEQIESSLHDKQEDSD